MITSFDKSIDKLALASALATLSSNGLILLSSCLASINWSASLSIDSHLCNICNFFQKKCLLLLSPILLTGGTGLFGRTFLDINSRNKENILAPTKLKLDVTDRTQTIGYLTKFRPQLIIHAAALVGIRECEKDYKLCKKINITGTKNIALYAKNFGVRFIYISTDYVFDGNKGNYSEKDIPNPVSCYGKTKYGPSICYRSWRF